MLIEEAAAVDPLANEPIHTNDQTPLINQRYLI